MLKGVNKQIIEIKCPKDEYFEKILLFVNSDNCNLFSENLNDKAKIYADEILKACPRVSRAERKILKLVFGLCVVLMIVVAVGAVFV